MSSAKRGVLRQCGSYSTQSAGAWLGSPFSTAAAHVNTLEKWKGFAVPLLMIATCPHVTTGPPPLPFLPPKGTERPPPSFDPSSSVVPNRWRERGGSRGGNSAYRPKPASKQAKTRNRQGFNWAEKKERGRHRLGSSAGRARLSNHEMAQVCMMRSELWGPPPPLCFFCSSRLLYSVAFQFVSYFRASSAGGGGGE